MAGFPGETDEDFMATYRLIDESPLTYIHVFPYSSRPGTVAAELGSHIPDHVARHRGKLLRDLVAEKNQTFRRSMIGRTVDVLTLEDGTGISSNFVRVSLPAGTPANHWTQAVVTALDDNGVQATVYRSA
jgi:threonylcarbamoyladenosine tRNA methylthiotransferase MtaB